jgi:hypothetical protein
MDPLADVEASVLQILKNPSFGPGAMDIASAQELKTRVRIPPGYKVFKEILASLLCIADLKCIGCVFKMRHKGIGRTSILGKLTTNCAIANSEVVRSAQAAAS